MAAAAPAPPPPTPAELIAQQFLVAVDGRLTAGDVAGLSMFYGDDSQLCFDGAVVPAGRASIASAIAPRFAAGPIRTRYGSTDAQAAPAGFAVVLVMGDTSSPAVKFTQVFVLFPTPAGGMYIRGEIFRSTGSAGAAAANVSLDPPNRGYTFVQQYYSVYQTARASMVAWYGPTAQLKFATHPTAVGPAAIAAMHATMPAGAAAPDTLDVLPLGPANLIVLVNGRFRITGEENTLFFVHVFHLVLEGAGMTIANEIFQFNYA